MTEEWPDSELPKTFDWSLSMAEIERKYLSDDVGPDGNYKRQIAILKMKLEGKTREVEGWRKMCQNYLSQLDGRSATLGQNTLEYLNRLKSKYPYAHSLIPSPLVEWIQRNHKI